jgi:NADPH2:quinone reductase
MTATLASGRRVVVTEFAESPDEALERFVRIEAQPAPDAAELAPDEVVVGIRAAQVAWVDLLMTSGQYQHVPTPPYVPGMEYAGVVLAVGPAVDPARCAVGDRVIADYIRVGARSGGAYRHAGGFASYAVVPDDALIRIPGRLGFDEAASLLGAYETAWHCLIARGRVQAGETVLIAGASGLTGLASVQVAKLLGATVIALGRSDEKLAVVKAHGADHVVNVRGEDGGVRRFRDDVKALTGGRGVDVVYDAVGGDTSLECLRCVAFDARFLIVGWTSTPAVARGRGLRGAPNANLLPTNLIQMKQLSVLGCPAVISVGVHPASRAPRLAEVLRWAEQGLIRPVVSHAYPLERFHDAMVARWRGNVVGGCVLNP